MLDLLRQFGAKTLRVYESGSTKELRLTKGAGQRSRVFFLGRELSPLIEAIHVGSVPIVKLLLQSGADTHEKQILATACYRGSLEIVQTLVSAGLQPGPSDLMMAVEYNQVHVAEYLLKAGVGMNGRLPVLPSGNT